MLVQVALPVPLYQVFDYSVPEGVSLPAVGCRVAVPFGSRKRLVGVVVSHVDEGQSEVAVSKLKAVSSVLDDEPLFDDGMLRLAYWLAGYYHYPLGDVLAVMLPTLIRQGKPLDLLICHWRVLPNVSETDFHGRAVRQKQQFELLSLYGEAGASEDVLLLAGMQRTFLRQLEEKGLVEHYFQQKPMPKAVSLSSLPLALNTEQQQAVDKIVGACQQGQYQGFLLNGITGSGKTEVYLQVMQSVLEAGRQVLVLVPEIGLTPQTRARFANRFVANIVLLHSGLTDTQRMQGWQDCRTGQAQIVIGTRSSVLYPFANLGLIVVDEAHDVSYKQQDTLRYHATDVALYRGYQLGIPVVLGTATPTLEQLKLVADGKLVECRLKQRAGNAKVARLQLVDARQGQTHRQRQVDGQLEDVGLTEVMVGAIRETLEAGKQVLVFLNRRGFAPVMLCSACGWQADCPRCETHLTVHHQRLKTGVPSFLKCHHCDWQMFFPNQCPECGSQNLTMLGVGTTRLSEHLHAIFSNPQTSQTVYPIIQIDRDTTRKKDSWQKIYERILEGKPAILVGTQMVAKGHHFPNVTLVALPNADSGFLSADFRSPEHTAQLIVQVAGRAGRGCEAGRVLIQTLQPENPLLLRLVNKGYQAFAKALLEERKLLGFPPYSYAGLVRCEGKSSERTINVLKEAVAILPRPNQLAILGPVDAPMAKKNGRYHSQLLLLSKNRPHLHQVLQIWWQQVLQLPSAKYLKLTLDIDPVGW